jgi:hypothetical protein
VKAAKYQQILAKRGRKLASDTRFPVANGDRRHSGETALRRFPTALATADAATFSQQQAWRTEAGLFETRCWKFRFGAREPPPSARGDEGEAFGALPWSYPAAAHQIDDHGCDRDVAKTG